MDQKTIFITGAASGIGRETAKLFARQGWLVAAVDRNEPGLKTLEAEMGTDRIFTQVMDVSDPTAFRESLEAFMARTGDKLNVLFNNAGILKMGPNDTVKLADQHRIVDINLKAVLTGIDCSLPFLKQTTGARIITMCSTSAIYGIPELAVYSATKHGVRALTEALDIELERYGIIVSDIIAPYVNTPMITTADYQAHSVASTGINLQPHQIAATVWKAAHGKKLHWKVHYLTFVLSAAFCVLPFLRRPLVKFLCWSSAGK